MAKANGGSDTSSSKEFASFKRWLFSLNAQQLSEAMDFTFHATPGDQTSHEYELLLEMVRMESPPPTPVHPRAMGFPSRMSKNRAELDFPHGDRARKRNRPQLFQWLKRESYRPRGRKGKEIQKYDVIARKKVAPWGEVYSLGCTTEQMEADRFIVQSSFVRVPPGSEMPQLRFRSSKAPKEVILALQIASRGNLLSFSPGKPSAFHASWLLPTQRWFSMSFYLASRYHLSLWDAFLSRKSRVTFKDTNNEPSTVKRLVPLATGRALGFAMVEDSQGLKHLRDSLVWDILVENSGVFGLETTKKTSEESILDQVRNIPLSELASPRGKIQARINQELDALLLEELQRSIIEEGPMQSETSSSRVPAKGKKKKKAKKKKRARNIPMSIPETPQVEPNDQPEERHDIQFPPYNGITKLERNRNIILALTIIEEAIEATFEEVGLEPSQPISSEETDELAGAEDGKDERPSTASKVDAKEKIQEAQNHVKNHVVAVPNRGLYPRSPFSPSHEPHVGWPVDAAESSAFHPFVPRTQNTLGHDFYHGLTPADLSFPRVEAEEDMGDWPFYNRFQAREQSILSDFFRSQEDRTVEEEGDDENLMVASTAASISSSTYKDSTLLVEADDIDKVIEVSNTLHHIERIDESNQSGDTERDLDQLDSKSDGQTLSREDDSLKSDVSEDLMIGNDIIDGVEVLAEEEADGHSHVVPRSPSPEAPLTPPPTLSPILVSLADLRELKHTMPLTPERLAKAASSTKSRSFSATTPSGSLPNSPTQGQETGLNTSWSRDDLRIASFRDDQIIKSRRRLSQNQRTASDIQPSYRAAAIKSLAKPIASSKATNLDFRSQVLAQLKRDLPRESCARSETAVEGQHDDQHWHNDVRRPEDFDGKSFTKDETTTITSALSNREPEEIATLREERNTYRDMCLTLGAEVAKLKAMLAAQQATTQFVPMEYQEPYNYSLHRPASFDPHGMQPFFHGIKRGQRLGPMSDAGGHRGGDHESQVSEDDAFEPVSKARLEMMRQMSSNATVAESDVSLDFNNSNSALQSGAISVLPVYDAVPVHGLQSRLTKDILRFLNSTNMQLKKQNKRRRTAIERFSRLVTAIWPRAQVKLYGSHMSGLCLPSSDLDFVVCLPAVHKNAPALAPGVLEGRNAINESSQKLLARELKGESWIDPRSIKLIERTVVPVIKVSTKDTRARVLQLDISFDSPEHHGLEANEMVALILEDLPLIRPLMLILKQFLLDRGLLTAYTGGLSSYCLFLMVARYLQEQPHSVGDCGSLLMGFLDFYGNHFDPRTTGISVRRRHYFPRSNNFQPEAFQQTVETPVMWTPPLPHVSSTPHSITSPASVGPHDDYLRRNSFSSETGSVDGGRRSSHRPPRFQASPSHRYMSPSNVSGKVPNRIGITTTTNNNNGTGNGTGNGFGHGRPFTFDPLFVEDPLSSNNNVGRNAFRIFQVQRAFSDAHRALVASLEWDIHAAGELNDGVEYPLLKCLLQSEDVFYEL